MPININTMLCQSSIDMSKQTSEVLHHIDKMMIQNDSSSLKIPSDNNSMNTFIDYSSHLLIDGTMITYEKSISSYCAYLCRLACHHAIAGERVLMMAKRDIIEYEFYRVQREHYGDNNNIKQRILDNVSLQFVTNLRQLEMSLCNLNMKSNDACIPTLFIVDLIHQHIMQHMSHCEALYAISRVVAFTAEASLWCAQSLRQRVRFVIALNEDAIDVKSLNDILRPHLTHHIRITRCLEGDNTHILSTRIRRIGTAVSVHIQLCVDVDEFGSHRCVNARIDNRDDISTHTNCYM